MTVGGSESIQHSGEATRSDKEFVAKRSLILTAAAATGWTGRSGPKVAASEKARMRSTQAVKQPAGKLEILALVQLEAIAGRTDVYWRSE